MRIILVVSSDQRLESSLPAGWRSLVVRDLAEGERQLGAATWSIAVVDAEPGVERTIAWLRRRAPHAPIVAIADRPLADVDALVAGGARHGGELARAIRYLAGEPTRRAPRVACRGRATLVDGAGAIHHHQLVDLSEDGARIAPAPAAATAITHATLELDGGEVIRAEVRELRRGDDAIVLSLREAGPAVRSALRTAIDRVQRARPPAPARPRGRSMIGASRSLTRAIETLERVAATDVTVLVLGETGTGKELAARMLHEQSARARGPFVAVNCAALPEQLVESELFGHEPGAFTGAAKRRIGRIEQAHLGTLFLDEIGDLPSGAQAKLLRALQERVIERLGGGDAIRVDMRLVAATNRDLGADIANRTFRSDLFYRLSVVTARLPPLRERAGDIRELAAYFLGNAIRALGRPGVALGEAALARLEGHPWPGNVRELENVVTRVVALADPGAIIGPDHLELGGDTQLAGCPLPSTELRDIVDYCEREIIRRMLERHDGNRTHTAAALNISRQALQQKLARFRARADADVAELAAAG